VAVGAGGGQCAYASGEVTHERMIRTANAERGLAVERLEHQGKGTRPERVGDVVSCGRDANERPSLVDRLDQHRDRDRVGPSLQPVQLIDELRQRGEALDGVGRQHDGMAGTQRHLRRVERTQVVHWDQHRYLF